ncbi:hypothetical protein VOLCADRAFT_106736 [Volvox carteri f. nagariensis]|uniref:Uncharacterized protein n=1 Tax=Volvox carteri f. nagariensis TaxID=3068 RepID=D8U9D8_VOLCA|nr:uncharacterized protein VOLCADRAFT_106736 [Volvox carteri f. nagariensis]EFJ43624.1 hypothetical protein VOLCADRAFT_106736 [Volvox carteri f. nagariensis]|eukprot:XP_002955324.1 hypothetical protein VOLCADRAFT_106736 [Volvox carteri f. nagariensis]
MALTSLHGISARPAAAGAAYGRAKVPAVTGRGVARRTLRVSATHQPVGSTINGATPSNLPRTVPSIFSNIESMIQTTFNSTQPGQRNDWREVEGCYVLFPPSGRPPAAVAHFLGGPFVGAAPQMTYRLFLEALANRDILVVATPYSTSFDHLRIADESQFKFDRAIRALAPSLPSTSLPTYGVGHSLGGLIHLLISARYAVQRSGNVLMSYNNRPASDVIPLLTPLIVPSARVIGPLVNQLAASPIRSTVENITETVKGLSPSIVRQVLPLVEQLAPIYLDAAQGKYEFLPTPEETRMLIRTYYGVSRNMLLRFKDDHMDDTNNLVQLLQGSSAVGEVLDLAVRTLPGDHLRPMQQAIVDLPPEVARLAAGAVESTGEALGRLASVATQLGVQQATVPLEELSRGVVGMSAMFGGQVGGPVTDSMQSLADEVAAWMGSGAVAMSGTRALPAASLYGGNIGSGAAGYGPGLSGL